MEIEVLDGFKGKDKFYHIKQFNLLCITVLGDNYEPAMGENATIELFSKTDSESFATKFSAIINKANEIVGKMSTEGGKKVKREEIISKFSILNEQVEGYTAIIENAELSDEDLEKQLFALSQNQINTILCDALCSQQCIKQDWYGNSYECDKYCLIDTIPTENVVVVIDCECYKYFGIPYTITGDVATLDYENIQQYVIGDWRPFNDGGMTQDDNMMENFINKTFGCKKEMDDNNNDMPEGCKGDCENCDEEMKKQCSSKKKMTKDIENEKQKCSLLENELNSVKGEFVTLKSDYTVLNEQIKTLTEENKDLKQFKADKELEFKKAQVDEVLEKYTELQSIDGYNDLIKDKFDYSLDELEVKLKVFAFDNNITISKKQKFTKNPEKPVDLAIEKKITSENLGDWDILADCLPNK
jgi:uncharacterized coiled-coil DUF342 family protein